LLIADLVGRHRIDIGRRPPLFHCL
jgi:hypothetical protein